MKTLENNEKKLILNKFIETMEGKAHTYINDSGLGTGGFADINDKLAIKLNVFPYPQEIIITVIEKYAPYIIAGKDIKTYKAEINGVNEETLTWVQNTLNEIKREY